MRNEIFYIDLRIILRIVIIGIAIIVMIMGMAVIIDIIKSINQPTQENTEPVTNEKAIVKNTIETGHKIFLHL